MQNVTKLFGKSRALDGFNLEVTAGSIHGFLGPNGAGKTTTLRILLGLYRVTSGQVTVLGQDPRTVRKLNRQVAYVPGDVNLWANLRGAEVIELLAHLRGKRDINKEKELIERFDLDPSKKIRTYSKGNKQKVALIAALSAPVDLFLFDEPTAGLDPLMEEVFTECLADLAKAGSTVLLSSHILSEVERTCNVVTIIKEGKQVVSGLTEEINQKGSLQELFLAQYES